MNKEQKFSCMYNIVRVSQKSQLISCSNVQTMVCFAFVTGCFETRSLQKALFGKITTGAVCIMPNYIHICLSFVSELPCGFPNCANSVLGAAISSLNFESSIQM